MNKYAEIRKHTNKNTFVVNKLIVNNKLLGFLVSSSK